jgi:hypothetical protein
MHNGDDIEDLFPQTLAMVNRLMATDENCEATIYKDDWKHFRPNLTIQVRGKKYSCLPSDRDRLYYLIAEKRLGSNVWISRKEIKSLGLRAKVKYTRGIMMINPVNREVESFLNLDQLTKNNAVNHRQIVKKQRKPVCSEFEKVDAWIKKLDADIVITNIFPAYFSEYDRIVLPPKNRFRHVAEFYKTLFHEIGHWTAHPDRCNRPEASSNTPDCYCVEELVAEIYSNLIAEFFELNHDMNNSLVYMQEYIDSMLCRLHGDLNRSEALEQIRLWVNKAWVEAKIAACRTLKVLDS